ncbi:receptor-type tyrosine-protein phosphatase beta-like [Lytechinus variegatus]|uniref:receptor-type tyrosine-protein phosphatase beta-like n=1 Tax=Lytechinus variegatus TaxID=7654 RepID=UPI001BB14E73|nr:receptor-type tyrosine-protein phosphatase beta-like [Lytechinus variegatus]
MWPYPGGLVDFFEVDCSNGTESNATVLVGETDLEESYLVRCDSVWSPGDNYTMVVTSVSNERENSASIVLTALPLSVNLVAGNSTTTSVSATWEFPGGVVDEFEVECNNGTKMMSSVEGMGYLASCEELDTPGDNYTLIVTSVSNGQRNSASIVLTALPLSVNLVAGNSTTTSVSATWEFPGGVVDEFEVECNNGTKMMSSVEGMGYLASCEELDTPGDNYTMIVTSVSNGQRNSASIVLTALPLSVNLVAGNSTTTSVSATWEFPGGVVDEFEVECNNGTKMMSSVEGMVYLASCEELDTPGDNYTMIVTSVSNGQRNSASIVLTALPLSVNLVAGNSTTTSVSATWEFPGGVVDEFEVECNNGTKMMSSVEGMGYLASCEELDTPGDNYTMIVTSVSNGQRNSASIVLTALPLSVNLVASNSTTTSVSATWEFPGGVLDEFEVECNNGTKMMSSVEGMGYLASCEELDTPGDNYTLIVTSVSNGQRNSASIVLTALPLSVNLVAGNSTTTSVSATWEFPGGVVDEFEVECNNGTKMMSSVEGMGYLASCEDLDTPGDNYTLIVTSVSNGQRNSASIVLTALPLSVNLVASNSTTTSVSATWEFPGGVVDEFEVECNNGTKMMSSVEGMGYLASCEDLDTPGDNYTMIVTSVSNGQRNSASIVLTALPLKVVLNPGNSTTTSVSATWQFPGGVVEEFEIQCSNGNGTIAAVQGMGYLASCEGLDTPGADYSMTVTSLSNSQRNSASIVLTALPEAVNLKEEVGRVTTNTIVASWSNVSGEFDYYEVTCSDGGNPSPPTVNRSDTLEASCTGLSPAGDNYTMSVTTVSNTKRSAVSNITITALPNAVALNEGPSNNTAISATWTISNDSVVDTFIITCSNGTAAPEFSSVDEADGEFTAYCVDLPTPGLEYSLTVVARSYGKQSAESTVRVHASPAAVALEEGDSTTTSVSANWPQPDSGVDSYRINCSRGDASPATIGNTSVESYTASCMNLTVPGDTYTMTVYSIVDGGNTSTSAYIDLVALPESVNLMEKSDTISTDSITASWSNVTGEFDRYEVTCPDGGDPSPPEVNPSDVLKASCTRLPTPGGNYTLSVTTVSIGERGDAFGKAKNSAESPITINTYPNTVNLTATSITTRQIAVQWEDPFGYEDFFKVDCGADGTTYFPLYQSNATNGTFEATCNVPKAGAEYNISVTSVSGDKDNAITDTITAATPEIVAFVNSSSNTTSITVTWGVLSGPDGYRVDCSNGTAPPSSLPSSATEVTCTGVTPGGNHSVSVVTLENNGESPAAVEYVVAVPLSASLSADDSTINSVSAMWPYPGGLVEIFEVECSNGTESNTTLTAGEGFSYIASCEGVWNSGDDYTMVVTSSSNGEINPATIVLTALPLSVELAAGNSTTTSVTAGWDFPGGVVDEFEVDCSNGTAKTNNVCAEYDYVASCDGLDNPGDNYTMMVTSLSNTQKNSAMIELTALPEAVTLKEASEHVTTSSIAATWDMPNGIVEDYEVGCSNGTSSSVENNLLGGFIASCDNLPTPGDDYEISVTSVSNGQRSETVTITITALPEAVDLEEGDSNTTTISATWTVPNSVVNTFNITCSDGNASPASISVNESQKGRTLTAYCTELPRSGEQYTLSVVAISKDKQSAPGVIQIYALPKGVVLEEGPSTLTSVNASWTKQNGTVESYSIKCSSGTADPRTINDTHEESYSAACVDLPYPGATYSLQVFSEVGISNNSRASSIISLVAVPESVEDISVTSYTTTTVTVQWRLKDCSGCVYNYFLLTFEPDTQDPIRVYYVSDKKEYSTAVSGLVQGRNFSFSVVSVSGVDVDSATLKYSAAETVEQRTVPATPTELSITPTKRTLTAVWKSVGDVDNFDITVTPNHGSVVFNGNLTHPSAEISDLTPGTIYSVSVVALSGDERSEPKVGSNRTLPDTPSQVRNPQAEVIDKNTITLTYEAPAEPNGEITHYVISYVGTRDGLSDHEPPSFNVTGLTVTVTDLRAGFTYVFKIIAVNDGDFESNATSTEPVTTFQEEPAPVPDDYPYEDNEVTSDISTTSFTVQLPEDLFSHDNGELLTFAVIITRVAGDPAVATTNLTFDEARAQSWAAYITSINNPYPYPATYESRRKRQTTNEAATVVIGDNSCVTESSKEYCNKPLNDDTIYYYAFRAYNEQGYQTSSTFGPVKTDKDNTTGIAVGVTVSVVTILMVVVISMVVVRKRRGQEPSPRPSLEGSDNPGFVGPDMEMGNRNKIRRKIGSSMHRKSHSKPILLNDFEDHYKRMKADSDLRFTEEYDEIRQVGKDQAIIAATEMVNRAKNRFTNILPYEHSRVKLAALADEPDSDYINANYMPGFNSPREFIACQGPLPGTVDDVWRMIWEKNTSIIVMLTQLVEKGKIKCHQYWPADYNPVTYGSIQVSLQAIQQYDHWVIREFSVAQGNEIRKLTQYHFMSWPDHGVPDQTITMLDFVRTVREAIRKGASEQPIVAHCSAGVGRTGTYIALDRLMQAMQENDFIDIFGIICEMRMQRNHMVQTEKQYIFIHECVMDLLRRGDDENDNGESLYVNLPANGFGHEDVSQNLLDQAV